VQKVEVGTAGLEVAMSAERVPEVHDQVAGVDSIGQLADRRNHHLDVGVESLAYIVGCPLDPVRLGRTQSK